MTNFFIRSNLDIAEDADYKPEDNCQQQLLIGDSRHLLETIPENSIQSVITSPPYWGLRSYGASNEIGAEATLDEYLGNISDIFTRVKKVLKQDGTLWIVIGDGYTSGNRTYRDADKKHSHRAMSSRPRTPPGLKTKDLIGLAWRVAFRLQSDGWYLRSEVIWHKTNPIPESVKDRPHQSHEHIFLFSKSQKYQFDWDQLRSSETSRNRSTRSVWTVSVNSGASGHAAPFPADLIKPCLLASTYPRDTVLDPFAGSGSVGVTCKLLNRSFIGIELVAENASMASSRLETILPVRS